MPATSLSDTFSNTLAPALKWLGYEQFTDLSAAVALSPPAGAIEALIQCKDAAIRWRCDATNPVAGTGATLGAAEALTLVGLSMMATFKAINDGGTAELNVSYWG